MDVRVICKEFDDGVTRYLKYFTILPGDPPKYKFEWTDMLHQAKIYKDRKEHLDELFKHHDLARFGMKHRVV